MDKTVGTSSVIPLPIANVEVVAYKKRLNTELRSGVFQLLLPVNVGLSI